MPTKKELAQIYYKLHCLVSKCHECTFTYHEKRYTVLGGLIGTGSSGLDCLWAEVLEVDGQKQTKPWMHVFYVSEIVPPIEEGPLRETASVDYLPVVRSNPLVSAAGPIQLQELLRRFEAEQNEKLGEKRAKNSLENLFQK